MTDSGKSREQLSILAENQQLQSRLQDAERQLDELRAEQSLLEALMETIPDDIYFKDRDGRFLRINQAKALRSGLTDPHTARGKTDADFFQTEHADSSLAQEREIMDSETPLVDKIERCLARWTHLVGLGHQSPSAGLLREDHRHCGDLS